MVIKLPNTKVVAFESKQTIGANCSFYVKTIETHAHAFFKFIIFSIGIVYHFSLLLSTYIALESSKSVLPYILITNWSLFLPIPEGQTYWAP